MGIILDTIKYIVSMFWKHEFSICFFVCIIYGNYLSEQLELKLGIALNYSQIP